MKLLRSLALAFSMYSKIPMPRTKWEPENMSWALCFFPLVGVAVGGAMLAWFWLAQILSIGAVLKAAGMVLIPLAISGCIHLDGFSDTCDALSSNQPRERKLEILKDSHVGAFAPMCTTLYLIFFVALWSEAAFDWREMMAMAVVPVLSRALSAAAAVSFKNARGSGMLATFSGAAKPKAARMILLGWTALAAGLMLWLSPSVGAAAAAAAGAVFIYYRIMSYREFGGITGDLAGYFLQLCELGCLLAAVGAQKIGGLL